MKVLRECLNQLTDFEQMQKELRDKKAIAVSGCVDSQKVHFMRGLSEDFPYRVIITHSEIRARELYEDFSFYSKDVYFFPAKDFIFFQADINGNKVEESLKDIAIYSVIELYMVKKQKKAIEATTKAMLDKADAIREEVRNLEVQ